MKFSGLGLLDAVAGRRDRAVGLDIGSGSVKAVEVELHRNQPTLRRMISIELPDHAVEDGLIADEAAVTSVLQRVASKTGFSTNQVVASLGGRTLFIREVTFPRMSETELREAIRWDLERYVPFSPEQLYFDFAIVGPGLTETEVRVLLVAVQKDSVDVLFRVLTNAGFRPIAIDIDPLAIHRTLVAAENCMLIDVGALLSQVTLFQKNSPVFTRSIPIGGQRFTETLMDAMQLGREEAERKIRYAPEGDALQPLERVIDELSSEVRRTLEYYQVQNRQATIDRVFLTGGGARVAPLKPLMARYMELPVFVHEPLGLVAVPSSFDAETIRNAGSQMAVALGLAIRGAGA